MVPYFVLTFFYWYYFDTCHFLFSGYDSTYRSILFYFTRNVKTHFYINEIHIFRPRVRFKNINSTNRNRHINPCRIKHKRKQNLAGQLFDQNQQTRCHIIGYISRKVGV